MFHFPSVCGQEKFGVIGLKNRIAFAILALVLCSSIIFAVAGMQTAGGLVLVNSYRFEDVIGGAVYSAERGDDYLFVLTPQQGEYVANYLSTYRLPIAYFESDRPVVAGLDSAIQSARVQDGSLVTLRQTDLALWFADNSKSASAIIVGRTDGAEAVSVSSYAVLHKSGLYFTDAARAGVLTARLRAGNLPPEAALILDFCEGSKRGIARPRRNFKEPAEASND